jgi:UDP-4-amino-4,6-dideoxy-N-acetyl-beta-L-altrosamine transaminase
VTAPRTAPAAFLPYGTHVVDEDDIAAVAEVLRSSFLTTGPAVERFEAAFAKAVGVAHVVSCSSGTSALHMACYALGLDERTVVIVPTITFLATANAARFTGAEVVFADVDPDTGLLTAETFEAAIARTGRQFPKHRIGAVFPVHLNGQSVDMAGISAVARRNGIAVVEDACHAVGGQQTGDASRMTKIGGCSLSDIACFSFHPVKTIAAGEGGACTTRNTILAERMSRFRNHGIVRDPARFTTAAAFDTPGTPNPWFYEMPEPGLNYRASDIHCALVLSQLGKLKRFVGHRHGLVEHYRARLAPHNNLIRPVPDAHHGTPAWHLMAVHINFEAAGISRATLMARLRESGIGTQVHYIPVHTQPYYQARYGTETLPGAQHYYATALSLPLSTNMQTCDIDRVVDTLVAALRDSNPTSTA